MQGEYKKASEALEKAAAADPEQFGNRALAGAGVRTARRDVQPVYSAGIRFQGKAMVREVRRS